MIISIRAFHYKRYVRFLSFRQFLFIIGNSRFVNSLFQFQTGFGIYIVCNDNIINGAFSIIRVGSNNRFSIDVCNRIFHNGISIGISVFIPCRQAPKGIFRISAIGIFLQNTFQTILFGAGHIAILILCVLVQSYNNLIRQNSIFRRIPHFGYGNIGGGGNHRICYSYLPTFNTIFTIRVSSIVVGNIIFNYFIIILIPFAIISRQLCPVRVRPRFHGLAICISVSGTIYGHLLTHGLPLTASNLAIKLQLNTVFRPGFKNVVTVTRPNFACRDGSIPFFDIGNRPGDITGHRSNRYSICILNCIVQSPSNFLLCITANWCFYIVTTCDNQFVFRIKDKVMGIIFSFIVFIVIFCFNPVI